MKLKTIFIILIFFMSVFNTQTAVCAESHVPDAQEVIENKEFVEKANDAYSAFSPQNILSSAITAVKEAFKPTLKTFSVFLAMILISAIAGCFSTNLSGFDISGYASTLCFSGYSFAIVKRLCENLSEYAVKLRDISLIITPTLISANAAQGVASAKTAYSALTFVLLSCEFLITSLIIPLAKILFVMSVVSCICRQTLDLSSISSALRTFVIFCISLVMTAIVTALHFQNVIAKATDSVGLRAVRFTATNLIPIVGGLVGESVKTVTEALRAVKGITGAVGVASVISACLPPLSAILVFKLELSFCACLAKTLGCKGEAAYLSETASILNVFNAAILACTIGFSAVICITAHSV